MPKVELTNMIMIQNPETKEIEKSANLKCAAEAVYYKGDYFRCLRLL